jgi:hypothetical protein
MREEFKQCTLPRIQNFNNVKKEAKQNKQSKQTKEATACPVHDETEHKALLTYFNAKHRHIAVCDVSTQSAT